MIYFYDCDVCKHIHEKNIDGWRPCCDAFPEGWPKKGPPVGGVKKLKECNNGYHYEYDEKWDED